jgi:hypothetical protein
VIGQHGIAGFGLRIGPLNNGLMIFGARDESQELKLRQVGRNPLENKKRADSSRGGQPFVVE